MSAAQGEDLAETLTGAAFLAQRYARERWHSVPHALEAMTAAVVRMAMTPGPEACSIRSAALLFAAHVSAVHLIHRTGDRDRLLREMESLAVSARTVAEGWEEAALLGAHPVLPPDAMPLRVLH